MLGLDVWKDTNKIKRRIGALLEHPSYPSGLTVKQYFRFVQNLYKVSSEDCALEEWSQKMSLPLNRPITELSAGMCRKMGILAAMIGQVEVVIMDEPTANVDPLSREEILHLILEIQKQYDTKFLLSSHLLSDLEKITDEIIVLVDGKIVDAGNTLNIIAKYGKSNEFTCTTLQPELFVAFLQDQEWVLEVLLVANQIVIKTKINDYQEVFQQILRLAHQENIQVLNINRTGGLMQVFRRASS